MTEPTEGKTIRVRQQKGETDGQTLARVFVGPELRHGVVASAYGLNWAERAPQKPELMDCADFVQSQGDQAAAGDLAFASRMLAAQALSLDAMFTEMARRAALNFGSYLDAGERYARLALKAQAGCRATLEALAKLHQPREQTVRHVHVNEGGQAIVADQFHHHTGGRYVGSAEQSHATATASAGAPMPRANPIRDAVPVASREGA